MLKNDRVTLINKSGGHTDIYGGYVQGEETSKQLMCSIQPITKELLQKKYGYDISASRLMLCDLDTDIKVGSIVVFNNIRYEIVKIPWDLHHMEAVLSDV